MNNVINDETKSELRQLYKENTVFLEKAIFAASSIFIPLLFNVLVSDRLPKEAAEYITYSLCGFSAVLILQTISFRLGKEGCDIYERNIDRGEVYFTIVNILDWIKDAVVILSLVSVIFAAHTAYSTPQKNEATMSDDKKVLSFTDSFTLPKSQRDEIKKANAQPQKTPEDKTSSDKK